MSICFARAVCLVLVVAVSTPLLHAQPVSEVPTESSTPAMTKQAYQTRTIRVPGTTVAFDIVRCPAPTLTGSQPASDWIWVLTTEVPWELYDIYVYRLDQPEGEPADAIARPSKPYVPPDRGFGHQGYPAMGMTRQAAEGFCAWLSEKTGITFRLPTDTEWTHLASPPDAHAWSKENANYTTHPVARQPPNQHGLHDMLGNVAEWVMADGRRSVAMGGSYRDPPDECTPDSVQRQDRSWNASDPQIPKSQWWLADCSWVGFRFVTEQDLTQENTDDQ